MFQAGILLSDELVCIFRITGGNKAIAGTQLTSRTLIVLKEDTAFLEEANLDHNNDNSLL